MKRDEILNIPAGREMDALILEKVFGYVWRTFSGNSILFHPDDNRGHWWVEGKTGTPDYDSLRFISNNHKTMPIVPNYSTKIGDAWEVVEKLRLMVRPSVIAGKWIAAEFIRVYLSGKWEGVLEVTADTAPLAICRAALLAVMDKE